MDSKETPEEGNVGKISKDFEAARPSSQADPIADDEVEKKTRAKKYLSKHMKLYPELYRSDASMHPSYTRLKNFPYYVVCRQRVQRTNKLIARQLNREILHFAMMRMYAIDSVSIERVFSIGMSPKTLIVPDFATENGRRHLNELLRDT